MDMDGLMGSSPDPSRLQFHPTLGSSNQKDMFGSGVVRQGRGCGVEESEEEDWGCAKMVRTEAKMAPLVRSETGSLFPDGQQMLSFSSHKNDAFLLCNDGSLSYQHSPSLSSPPSAYGRCSGVGMHGVWGGSRGAFTPSQWLELEHQAIIYKCIDANVPIPTNLLISIQKGPNPSAYTAYSASTLRSNAYGWGSFQLGFSGNNNDPEPGRCRRTDGKKWRCSRDAVVDQKYCERHLNRGRHRSRKPVEGQSGHAKAMSTIASLPAAPTVSGSSMVADNMAIAQQDAKNMGSIASGPSSNPFSRVPSMMDNMNVSQTLSVLNATNSKFDDTQFAIRSQQNSFNESVHKTQFGLASSDPIANSTSTSPKLNEHHPQPNPLSQFMDNWSKSQSDRSTINWPDMEETQLSISIPMNNSEFSSASSLSQDKMTLSPLRQSHELDPIHMSLGVGGAFTDTQQTQPSWMPMWEASIGGPLGEALNNTNNTTNNLPKSSTTGLNLITYGWDSSVPPDSSPTGVLQKTTFGSLASSAGSSPRAGSICNDLLGSAFVSSASIPTL